MLTPLTLVTCAIIYMYAQISYSLHILNRKRLKANAPTFQSYYLGTTTEGSRRDLLEVSKGKVWFWIALITTTNIGALAYYWVGLNYMFDSYSQLIFLEYWLFAVIIALGITFAIVNLRYQVIRVYFQNYDHYIGYQDWLQERNKASNYEPHQ